MEHIAGLPTPPELVNKYTLIQQLAYQAFWYALRGDDKKAERIRWFMQSFTHTV